MTKAGIWFQHNSYHLPNNSVLTVVHDPVYQGPRDTNGWVSLNMAWWADTRLSLLAHLLCHNVWPLETDICETWGAPERCCWHMYWLFIDRDDSAVVITATPGVGRPEGRRRPLPAWNAPDDFSNLEGWENRLHLLQWSWNPPEAHLNFTFAAKAFVVIAGIT